MSHDRMIFSLIRDGAFAEVPSGQSRLSPSSQHRDAFRVKRGSAQRQRAVGVAAPSRSQRSAELGVLQCAKA
jgi:hypothetical protein